MFIDDVYEIPNKLVTVIPPEVNLSDDVSIGFINKRKSKKSSITRLVDKLKMQVDISSDLFEVREIKNGLFKLELDSPYRIYVSHPELPDRTFKFYMNGFEPYLLMKLICDCGNVRSGVLGGEYYYDTNNNFFTLNNDDKDLKVRVQTGEYLLHWEKLVPGNAYVIEYLGACRRLIYLGKVENCFLLNYPWSGKLDYMELYHRSIDTYLTNYNNYKVIYKNTHPLNLLKDSLERYYLLPENCIKHNKGGLIKENVANGMSEKEFQALCVQNNWIAGLNPQDNREQMKRLCKDRIIKDLTYVLARSSTYEYIPGLKIADLPNLSSSDVSDIVINNTSRPYNNGMDFYFRIITNNSIFPDGDELETKDFYRSIWLEYFGKE